MRATTETKLLDAADALFFSRGIAATSVDDVLARAGVSSATLYRGYPSKEALVAAALGRRHERWIAVWDAAVARAGSAAGRVLAVFDALEDFRHQPTGARWCAFLGTAAEYADAPQEIRGAVARDTHALRTRLTELARAADLDGAADLAEQLLLVISGQLAMWLRDPEADTRPARSTAELLLRAAATATDHRQTGS